VGGPIEGWVTGWFGAGPNCGNKQLLLHTWRQIGTVECHSITPLTRPSSRILATRLSCNVFFFD